MQRTILLTTDEREQLARLGRRLRSARLARDLAQAEVAERAGVTRKTYQALEAGRGTASLGLLVKTLVILGYPEGLAALLTSDPIGDDLEDARGRRRAGRRTDVADF